MEGVIAVTQVGPIRFETLQDALCSAAVADYDRVWLSRDHFVENASHMVMDELMGFVSGLRGLDVNQGGAIRLDLRRRAWSLLLKDAMSEESAIKLMNERGIEMAEATKKKTAKGAKKGTTSRGVKKEKTERAAGGRRSFKKDQTIHVLVDSNPRREGSRAWDQFEIYKDNMTVADFLAAGGRRSALRSDTKRKHIEVS